MTTFIGGNSHVGALYLGLKLSEIAVSDVKLAAFGSGAYEASSFSSISERGTYFTNDEFAKNLLKITGKSYFDPTDLWGLCMGTHSTRILRRKAWSDSAPSTLNISALRPLSGAVVDEIISEDQRYIRAFIEQLRRTGVQCFVVSCPPLRRDNYAIVQGLSSAVAVHLDAVARKRFCDWLSSIEVPFIAPPAETYDQEGFLKDIFAQKHLESGEADWHHANPAYGKLMIEKIVQEVPTLRKGP